MRHVWIVLAIVMVSVISVAGCKAKTKSGAATDAAAQDGASAGTGGLSDAGKADAAAAKDAATGVKDSGTVADAATGGGGTSGGEDADVQKPPQCTTSDSSGCIDEIAGHTKSDLGNFWKDSWFIMGCPQHDQDGHDCLTVPTCPNQNASNFEDRGAVANETFPLGGSKGTTYAVSFQFNGLAEGKYYQDGQYAKPDSDAAMTGGPASSVNELGVNAGTFYIGGKAVATNYNVMRMRVLDADKKEVARYYMNAYPQNSGAESHRTFLMSYKHTIDVPGQGFIEYRFQDSNCKAVDNCNAGTVDDNGPCNMARKIPNEPNAVLPSMYNDITASTQPHLVPLATLNPVTGAMQPWHSQLAHVTITKVVAK